MLAAVAGAILLTWLVCAAILIGLGSLALRGFRDAFSLSDAFWFGLVVAVVLLEFWNLVFPITALPDIVLTCAAALGAYLNRAWLAEKLNILASHRLILAAFVAIAVIIALRCAGPCEYYDTGLYGAPAIRWIRTYPVVFGLANVHGRLGFASSVFLCLAALGQGPWKNLYFHLFAGLVLCAFWTAILPACARILRHAEPTSADWFRALLIIPASAWSARSSVVGTTTDEPSAILCLIAAAILFSRLERRAPAEATAPSACLKIVLAATLFTLAVTFKLSVAVFAFLGWIIAFALLCSLPRATRYVRAAFVAAGALFAPWIAAQVILSGYPFFPNSLFGLPVDWRVPNGIAPLYTLWVQSWARIAFSKVAETRGFAWLHPWFHAAIRDRASFQVPIAIALGGAAILAFARSSHQADEPRRLAGLWLLLPALAAILFWFWMGPDVRFAQAPIWTLAVILGSLAIVAIQHRVPVLRPRVLGALLLLPMAWCLFSFGWRHSYRVLESVDGFIELPQPRVAPRSTLSGVVVYVPVEGNQCWDAPLPCTPYFNKTLRLRDPSDMRWGFTSEGFPEFPPY